MTKDFELVKELVDGTDWDLLRQQKKRLVELREGPVSVYHTVQQNNALLGMVNWLDNIQDYVVKLGFLTEDDVFGPYCPKHGNYVEPEEFDKETGMCKKCNEEAPL